uniref:Putative ovule protein n=1 Tax=Solanum chacoense TaxID=4108 RepID=A0A0V0HEP5_SOLCH
MKAFDDAIADGVDIINLSFGQPAGTEFEFSKNPIAIGAFHAVQKGIFVVASGGNDGPSPESVVNVAPWIFTVAATTKWFLTCTCSRTLQLQGLQYLQLGPQTTQK